MSFFPHVTVATIVEQNQRFLLVEEQTSAPHSVFNQPAGHLEAGESLQQAAVRETQEETGYTVRLRAFIGSYLWDVPARPDQEAKTYLRFTFVGEILKHHPQQALDDGILAAHWLSYSQILERQARLRSPLVLRCLDDHLAGKHYPLELVQRLINPADQSTR